MLEHLGVPAGIPVVTKADLVDPDWLELVLAEVAERLAGSPVASSRRSRSRRGPVTGCPSSATRLAAQSRGGCAPTGRDLFRLPVDRAFSVAGVGTVVTGTGWSGRLAMGDAVALLPDGAEGRVRSIEMLRRALEHSEPGARTAVGIAGRGARRASRGQVLVRAGDPWQPTSRARRGARARSFRPEALGPRSRVRVHLGTAEVHGPGPSPRRRSSPAGGDLRGWRWKRRSRLAAATAS